MHLSLKARLIALCVGISAVAMIIVAMTNYLNGHSNSLRMLTQQAVQLADAHADKIGLWLADKQRVVSSLKDHAGNADPVPVLQTAVKAAGFDQAYVGYPDRRYVFSEQRKRAADYDPTQRPWYLGAVAAGGASITQPFIGASTGKLIITFSDLVGSKDNVRAVVAGDVMLDSVIRDVTNIHPTEHSFAFLVAGDGKLIAYPDEAMSRKGLEELDPKLNMAALQENGRVWTLQGREGFLFSQAVPGTNWRLVVVMDYEEATAALDKMLLTSIVSTVVLCLLVGILLGWVVNHILQRLDAIREAIVASGKGDFTQRLALRGHDELTQIAKAYNSFADNISQTLHRMRDTSVSVETATSEIAAGNQDLSVRTELQADSLTTTVSSVEMLTHEVRKSAENAGQANQLAHSASSVAQKGGDVVADVVGMMKEISHSSKKMADIIGVIDSIAFQTNILALNAAVEAARAGEQGRGFAVVASEVRNLAQRSASSAREISALISDSVSKMQNGEQMATQAGQTMQEIVESVQHVATLMGEISQASQMQSQEIEHINESVSNMEESTQQNTALVEEAAAAAASLKDQAVVMAQMVNTFKLGEQPPLVIHAQAPLHRVERQIA